MTPLQAAIKWAQDYASTCDEEARKVLVAYGIEVGAKPPINPTEIAFKILLSNLSPFIALDEFFENSRPMSPEERRSIDKFFWKQLEK